MDGFSIDLGQKLQAYAQELERTALPNLKTSFRNFTSIYVAFLDVLKKKGLLTEDPYEYDTKISEITPIANDPFIESQKTTVLSIRLHSFRNQLNFLNDFYQFSLDFLSLSRLKSLSQFNRFVRWDSLTETNAEANTRLVAEVSSRIRKGDDVSTGLINDMLGQLATYQTKIFDDLKKITFYKREEYKSLIRTTFWEELRLSPEEWAGNSDNVQLRIRKEFANHVKGQPFIPELIKELLDEDLTSAGGTLKEELLRKLTVTPTIKEKPKQVIDYKALVLEAVRTLASLNIPLEAAVKKLKTNTLVLEDDRLTMGKRFRRWLASLVGIKPQPRMYEIETFDVSTGSTKTETIDFEKFTDEVMTRTRILVNLANRASPQFGAMSQKAEPEILDTFDRYFLDLTKFNERFVGLDVYFKTESPKEKRAHIRGIKAEISQVKTTLANANKLKHEYVAAREEQEQLKKLGISLNP